MAITYVTSGSPTSTTGTVTPSIPSKAKAGDLMICVVGTKPYNGVNTINNGWTSIASYANSNNVPAGTNVGSMKNEIFYKIHTGTESNPSITNPTNNVSSAIISAFRKDTNSTWAIGQSEGGNLLYVSPDNFFSGGMGGITVEPGYLVFVTASIQDNLSPRTFTAQRSSPVTASFNVITDYGTNTGGDMILEVAYLIEDISSTNASYTSTTAISSLPDNGAFLGIVFYEDIQAVSSIDPFGMMGFFGI